MTTGPPAREPIGHRWGVVVGVLALLLGLPGTCLAIRELREDHPDAARPRPRTGEAVVIAGTGTTDGAFRDGVPATSARLYSISIGLAVDRDENVYVSDSGSHRVRVIRTNGTIHTVAGNGSAGSTGDGGDALDAAVGSPQGIAVDRLGNLYIASNGRVRKVAASGIISTVAQVEGRALTIGPQGDLFVGGDYVIHKVSPLGFVSKFAGDGRPGFSGEGLPAEEASITVRGLAVADDGTVYFTDECCLRRAARDKVESVSRANDIDLAALGDGGDVARASFHAPWGLGLASDGGLYIADHGRGLVRHVSSQGTVTTFAGGTREQNLGLPFGIAVGLHGSVFVSDLSRNLVWEIGTDAS